MSSAYVVVQPLVEMQNEDAEEVSQEEVFAGENYKRRYEVEGGEMVQDAGNKVPKTFRSDFK